MQTQQQMTTLLNDALRAVWDHGKDNPVTRLKLDGLNRSLKEIQGLELEVLPGRDGLLLFAVGAVSVKDLASIAEIIPWHLVTFADYVEVTTPGGVFVVKDRRSASAVPHMIPTSKRALLS